MGKPGEPQPNIARTLFLDPQTCIMVTKAFYVAELCVDPKFDVRFGRATRYLQMSAQTGPHTNNLCP